MPVSSLENISPFELFLPMPSLSTTFSLHLIRRAGGSSWFASETHELPSPLNLKVPDIRMVDDSPRAGDTVSSWECDAALGSICRVRDILKVNVENGIRSGWRERHRSTIPSTFKIDYLCLCHQSATLEAVYETPDWANTYLNTHKESTTTQNLITYCISRFNFW